jgi:hypothetical protein
VASRRADIESTGAQVAFVHMSTEEEANAWFESHGVGDVLRISDPDKTLYKEFGLEEASLAELMHPRVWVPWFRTAVLAGRGVGAAGPNWRQLTGVFLVHRDRILGSIRHRNSAARPDYVAFVRGLLARAG